MKYEELWPAIQEDVLGCLQADRYIGTRQGVAIEPGDVESILAKMVQATTGAGLDGKVGQSFFVLPIEEAYDDNPGIPGGPLKLSIVIQFVENVVLNRGPRGTQIPGRVWTAAAQKVLKLYTPVGLTQNFVPVAPVIYQFTPDYEVDLRIGQLKFTAVEADFRPFLKLSRPQITVTGAMASMVSPGSYQLTGPAVVTVNAPGADPGQVYYTTDGSHPYEGNPDAYVYDGPVTIVGPGLFRARAFAHAQTGSDTAAANFFQ